MVIVQLQGGLGGQMFQYAAASGIRNGDEAIYADLHALFGKGGKSAGYLLHQFPALRFPKVPNLVHRIFNHGDFPWPLLRTLLRGRFLRATQRGSAMIPRLQQRKRSVYLDGPFQNPAYFEKLRPRLLRDFAFPEPEGDEAMLAAAMGSRKDAVAVSIYRGTGGEAPGPAGPSLKYYEECVEALRSGSGQPHFYIFTNDTGWARQLPLYDESESTVIGPEISGLRAMQLKSCCAHHITAGNADDWWAAWLSQRNGQCFIPSEWYGEAPESTRIQDLATPGWTVKAAH